MTAEQPPRSPPPPDPATTVTATSPQSSNNPFKSEPIGPAPPSPPTQEAAAAAPQIPTRPDPSDPVNEPAQEESPPNVPSDPRVAGLKAMFPHFDDDTLLFVLDSVGGDQERAVDMLLGMSDPEYKSETTRPAETAQMSQTELDEQFARQLMLQDQQEHQERWQAQHQQPPQHGGYAPYTGQRQHAWSGQQQQPQPQPQPQSPGANPTMSEFQQQFSRIAETGRKSLGTFFSKVRAKINELDQPRPEQGTSAYPQQQQAQWSAPQNPSQTISTWTQQQQRQDSYYDPNTPAPPPRNMNSSPPPPEIPPASIPRTASPGPLVPGVEDQTPPPPRTNAGSPPIDGGRVGLLPKRPVSLIRPSEGSTTAAAPPRRRDSEETLEYAENPFEESGRR